MSLTYPHRKKSQGVRSGDLGGQSSNLFGRPCISANFNASLTFDILSNFVTPQAITRVQSTQRRVLEKWHTVSHHTPICNLMYAPCSPCCISLCADPSYRILSESGSKWEALQCDCHWAYWHETHVCSTDFCKEPLNGIS